MKSRKRDRTAKRSELRRHGGKPLRVNQRKNSLTPVDAALDRIAAERNSRQNPIP